jgi:Predicted transporter component|uniref:YeeE/YedE family protein n=1 Tax=Brucella pseudintermedia TaxID=370111 RepID=UPI000EFC726E|nr:YeeE/YedE thiosulfate transporter family protein [Brucella pseudintermedia]
MTEFTPLASLLGGAMIGLAAILLMAFHGRIAGMTGILSGLLPPLSNDWAWRAAFIAGVIVAPALIIIVAGASTVPFESPVPTPWLIIGGLIVGIGVHFGGGCTSGHGVCGLARLSPRSIAATLIFMASTALTVFVVRHLLGGF